jgi:hypothetical protein
MRVHISLEDKLVRELDRRVGKRRRSAFIAATVRQALADKHRSEHLLRALGSAPDFGADWGMSADEWVRTQRRSDPRRVG